MGNSRILGRQDAVDVISRWNSADDRMNRVEMCRKAVAAVTPFGDHLLRWLVDETMQLRYTDESWVRGVLKETIAEQRPDIPMTWLDERLPTRYPDDDLTDEGDYQ